MKIGNRLIIATLIISFIILELNPVLALKKTADRTADNNLFRFNTIQSSLNYEKIEIVNIETGEIEYIESFLLPDGNYKHVTTSNQGVFEIQKSSENEVTVTDLYTGEITTNVLSDSLNQKFDFQRDDIGPQSWENSAYQFMGSTRYSSELIYSTLGTLVSIIATIVGGKVTGVVTAIAQYLFSIKAKKTYWIRAWYELRTNRNSKKIEYWFYRYSDYTHLIGKEVIYTMGTWP